MHDNLVKDVFIGLAWVMASVMFGFWQDSAAAGAFMFWIIVCFRWNR